MLADAAEGYADAGVWGAMKSAISDIEGYLATGAFLDSTVGEALTAALVALDTPAGIPAVALTSLAIIGGYVVNKMVGAGLDYVANTRGVANEDGQLVFPDGTVQTILRNGDTQYVFSNGVTYVVHADGTSSATLNGDTYHYDEAENVTGSSFSNGFKADFDTEGANAILTDTNGITTDLRVSRASDGSSTVYVSGSGTATSIALNVDSNGQVTVSDNGDQYKFSLATDSAGDMDVLVNNVDSGASYDELMAADGGVVSTRYNADGSTTIFNESASGIITSIQNFDVGGNETGSLQMTYNSNDQLTGETVLANGLRTDMLAFDPNSGFETKDTSYFVGTNQVSGSIIYTNGVKSSEIDYYRSGLESDQKFFDNEGNLSGEAVFNQHLEQTDYLVFNTSTGELEQDREIDPNTHKQTETLLYQDGVEVGVADYATGSDGKLYQSDYKSIDSQTGNMSSEIFLDESGNRIGYEAFDTQTSKLTGEADFVDGQQVDYKFIDEQSGNVSGENVLDNRGNRIEHKVFDVGTGDMTQDTLYDASSGDPLVSYVYQNNQKVGQADYADGNEIEYQVIDPTRGDMTEDEIRDPASGIWTQYDFYQNNELTQERNYNAATGALMDYVNYNDGTKTDQIDFVNNNEVDHQYFTNDVLTSEAFYNSKLQQTGYATYDPTSGDMTEDEIRDPNSGIWTQLDFYQNNELTQERDFNTVTGALMDYVNYNAGTRTDQIDFVNNNEVDRQYFTNDVLTSEAFFNSRLQQTGYATYDPTSGDMTENEIRDPNSGIWTQLDFYQNNQLTQERDFNTVTGALIDYVDYSNGTKTNQIDFVNNSEVDCQYFTNGVRTSEAFFNSQLQQTGYALYDPASGDMTENEIRDPASGVWTQYDFYQNNELTQERDYNATTGALVDYVSFSNGTKTDEYTFDASTGVQTAALHYSDGELSTEATFADVDGAAVQNGYFSFNQQQQVTGQATFDANGQQNGYIGVDPSTEVVTSVASVQNGVQTGAIFYNDDPNNHYITEIVVGNGPGLASGWATFDSTGKCTEFSGGSDFIKNLLTSISVMNLDGVVQAGGEAAGAATQDAIAGLVGVPLPDLSDVGNIDPDAITDSVDGFVGAGGLPTPSPAPDPSSDPDPDPSSVPDPSPAPPSDPMPAPPPEPDPVGATRSPGVMLGSSTPVSTAVASAQATGAVSATHSVTASTQQDALAAQLSSCGNDASAVMPLADPVLTQMIQAMASYDVPVGVLLTPTGLATNQPQLLAA
ncbi:hypothetical protein BN2476_570013 [Paraburkholderia piptadeniae]|uniref:Uncharacterized protein n=2 Tax=Paraburkholderia piptadeniae TaxID=1701573 RepID=A0A1N7SJ64_9BURK|nr:hypothetical protein BN2476_570013 [Paraburkholderia piptadeniae]